MGGRPKAYRHPAAMPAIGAPGYPSGVEHLVWNNRPVLRNPVLVCAFKGWNDGGQAATLAATFLRESLGAERFVDIDPEEFYDFQETRPTVRLEDGLVRHIDWPENSVTHAELPGTERDILILLGSEPQLRWRTFSNTVLEVARAMNVELRHHARRPARRHAAHPPRAGHRHGRGRHGRAPRPQPLELRGPDRHRRRRARRLPRRVDPLREPVGRRARTTSRSRRTRRRRSRCSTASARCSRPASRRWSSARPPCASSGRCPRPSPRTTTSRATCETSSGERTPARSRCATCRRETSSQPSCRSSSPTAADETRRLRTRVGPARSSKDPPLRELARPACQRGCDAGAGCDA